MQISFSTRVSRKRNRKVRLEKTIRLRPLPHRRPGGVDVFGQGEGYTSDVEETVNDYRFISVLKKYDAKMLGIGDIVQPETTVTVYDYIRANLTQNKQQIFLNNAASTMSKGLHTAENVEMKKTGAALDKLLEWGK